MSMDFAALRAALVATLAVEGVRNRRVLDAFGRVPREEFVPNAYRADAYTNSPLPIGQGQTISQPLMIALMLQALDPRPGDRVLEVGTGSGYQAALLAELAGDVTTVERFPDLAAEARARLVRLGYAHVDVVVGDGSLGWPEKAPYSRIVVAAAAPQPPQPLLDQLADGGRLVVPAGNRDVQTLLAVERRGDTWHRSEQGSCRFVPLVGSAGWPETGATDERTPGATPRSSANGHKPWR